MNPISPDRIPVSIACELPADWPDSAGGTADPAISSPEWLAAAIRHGLAQALPPHAAGQVSLLLTDDAAVRELNRQYRGLDETTDVLSFSAQHGGHWQGDDAVSGASDADADSADAFPMPDGEPPPLGEIVISLPQAIRQANAAGVPLRRELALLLVHGALHLLGYDHYDAAEQAEMQALEQAALAAIFPDDWATDC